MKTVLAFILSFFVICANAAPVYLDCSIVNTAGGTPGPVVHSKMTLDEAAQTVTFTEDSDLPNTHPMGKPVTFPAQFTQDAVTFIIDRDFLKEEYTVDRTTLAFTGTYTVPGSPPNHGTGSCKIAKTIKRAF